MIEASNGIEALEALDENGTVDLVVSDVVMPEMDGPTLLRKMRVRNPDLKIILRVGLRRRSIRQESAGERAVRFPCEAFRAQCPDRQGQRDDDGILASMFRPAVDRSAFKDRVEANPPIYPFIGLRPVPRAAGAVPGCTAP